MEDIKRMWNSKLRFLGDILKIHNDNIILKNGQLWKVIRDSDGWKFQNEKKGIIIEFGI